MPSDDKRKLLVLDLDETLIHSSEVRLGRPADFRVGQYHTYRRPFLDEFLESCLSWFDVAVWTVGTAPYAAEIIANIFPCNSGLAFVWARERCTQTFDSESRENYWRKDSKKIRRRGYDLRQVIAVDDTSANWQKSYGNLVRVTPYYGAAEDRELRLLRAYLEQLRQAENVRAVEKRGWQQTVRL